MRQILVPRRDVIALPTNMSTGDGLRAVIAAGHSRAPVVGPRGLDDVSSGPYTTVAGPVLARLGHIPTTVDEVNRRAITRVRLRPQADPSIEPPRR